MDTRRININARQHQEEQPMIFVGDDRVEDHHDVAVLDEAG